MSVVIPTLGRSDSLPRAVHSVLQQTVSDLDLVVVDDGSPEAPLWIHELGDSRARLLSQEHAGVSCARNAGLAVATGTVVTFLDDDDEADSNWLEVLLSLLAQPACGVACCAATMLDPTAGRTAVRHPQPLGPAFNDVTALFLAGTFAAPRSLLLEVGGYAPGLEFSENTELALRLTAECRLRRLEILSIDRPLITVRRTDECRRAYSRASQLVGAVEYLVSHHHEALRRDPRLLAEYWAIAGVSSARLHRHADARRFFANAIRSRPTYAPNYGRLGAALVPTIAARVWNPR